MIMFEKVPFDIFVDTVNNLDLGIMFPSDHGFLYNTLHDLQMPTRATKGSAGYDIHTPFAFPLNPGKSVIIPTGLRCLMPHDVVLMLYPRSGLGFKYRLRLNNTVGVVDSDFANSDSKGHILLKLSNEGDKRIEFKANDRVCQGIFTHYLLTDDDAAYGERTGGFGSTDK